jgi:hypothetical protein
MRALVAWFALSCGADDMGGGQAPCADRFFADADEDGHGNPDSLRIDCATPPGFATTRDDCDDANASVHPGADEICDGVDDDCDGSVDVAAVDEAIWFEDSDGDGFGGPGTTTRCVMPLGFATVGGDCDDIDPAVHPAATEICDGVDDDCDALVDESDADLVDGTTWYADDDNDGYGDVADGAVSCRQPKGSVGNGDDCDDDAATAHPMADELCNGADDDCDELVDDADDDPVVGGSTFYVDADGDGLGDPAVEVSACALPKGSADNSDDCDDTDAAIGAAEVWYYDIDFDTYGSGAPLDLGCTAPGTAYVHRGDDCDDHDDHQHPGAAERCNEEDDNCDGVVDDDDPLVRGLLDWYADLDGDGFGGAAPAVQRCLAPSGYVSTDTDCDDENDGAYPGATEYCDEVDNDCDLTVDDSVDFLDWYRDDDGDGYGDPEDSKNACSPLSGYVLESGDCDDGSVAVHPDATEICATAIDEDCDDWVDNCRSTLDGADLVVRDADVGSWGTFGFQVVAADVDADGLADLVIGAPRAGFEGRVYLVFGPQTGTVVGGGDVTIDNNGEHSLVGYGLGAGDANDDGVDDVIIGAPYANAAYLFLGPVTADHDVDAADVAFEGPPISTGLEVDVVTDVTGDAIPDAVIGSPGTNSSYRPRRDAGAVGSVFVVSGATSGTIDLEMDSTYALEGHAEDDMMGRVIEAAGDWDGDGIDELVLGDAGADVGVRYDTGVVYVVRGGTPAGTFDVTDVALAVLSGTGIGDTFGSAVETGDLDQDGGADLVVGATGDSLGVDGGTAAISAFLGPLSGAIAAADADVRWDPGEQGGIGGSIAIGEVGGDTAPDLLFGWWTPDSGGASLQLDEAKGVVELESLPSFSAPQMWDGSTDVALVPDWNGDGCDEIAIGASATVIDGEDGGAVWVYSSDLFR